MPQERSAEHLCSLPWPCPATETSQNSHSSCQHLITFAGRNWGNLSSQNCRKELGNVTLFFSSQATLRNAQILRTNWPQTAPGFVAFCLGITLFPGAVDFLLSLSCFHSTPCLFRVQIKISVWLNRQART